MQRRGRAAGRAGERGNDLAGDETDDANRQARLFCNRRETAECSAGGQVREQWCGEGKAEAGEVAHNRTGDAGFVQLVRFHPAEWYGKWFVCYTATKRRHAKRWDAVTERMPSARRTRHVPFLFFLFLFLFPKAVPPLLLPP